MIDMLTHHESRSCAGPATASPMSHAWPVCDGHGAGRFTTRWALPSGPQLRAATE
jgi:hypothetical protein